MKKEVDALLEKTAIWEMREEEVDRWEREGEAAQRARGGKLGGGREILVGQEDYIKDVINRYGSKVKEKFRRKSRRTERTRSRTWRWSGERRRCRGCCGRPGRGRISAME